MENNKTFITSLAISLVFFGFILSMVLVTKQPNQISTVSETKYQDTSEIVRLVNFLREEKGLESLLANDYADQTAQDKANDMVANGYFAHTPPNGERFSKPIYKQFPGSARVSENLARCQKTDKQAVQDWKDSPEHYKAILADHTYIGVGKAQHQNGCWYYVTHFVK